MDASQSAALRTTCNDHLKNNRHVYALKAHRKKIAIIRLHAKNAQRAPLRIRFTELRLLAGGEQYSAEPGDGVIRKLSEFTWDFLLYLVLDFHPLVALVDLSLFLTGPLYNRRLRKQLNELIADDLLLEPDEEQTFLVGFRGLKKSAALEQLRVGYRIESDPPSDGFVKCEVH